MQEIRKGHLLQPLRWLIRAVAVTGLIYSFYPILQRDYWIGILGGTSPFTLGSVAVMYLLTEWSLLKNDVDKVDAIILSVIYSYAFTQSYELIFHFSFPVYIFTPPFLSGSDIRYLILTTAQVLPILLLRKHLSLKGISKIIIGTFLITWMIWIFYGFPQYFIYGNVYPAILYTSDPFNLSLGMNYGTKIILALFFISLLKPGIKEALWSLWYNLKAQLTSAA